MKLILTRHGETEENLKKINQGHLPGNLTDKGKSQAKKIAEQLRGERIDVIYCSDLKRTKDTLLPILKYHPKVPVHYVKELRERNISVFEGTLGGTIREYAQQKGINYVIFRPEGGESIKDLRKRTIEFYQRVLRQHPHETVLWVTHGGIVVNLLLHLKELPDERYKEVLPENAAITIIDINPPNPPTFHMENYVGHHQELK